MKLLNLTCVVASMVTVLATWSSSAQAQTPMVPSTSAGAAKPGSTCPAVLKHQFPRLQDDVPQDLCQYAGKVMLVVNTASYCGFTTQYEGLEALHARYQAKGLVVVGFPSNDFGQQEPGNAKQIADFCFNTYGVKFPMMAKTVVSGGQANPFYKSLASTTNSPPRWNFHKYLIDRQGKVLASFPSKVTPESAELVSAVEKALQTKL